MLSPRRWPAAAATVARTFGLRGATYRLVHEVRRATTGFLATPRRSPTATHSAHAGLFRVDAALLRTAVSEDAARLRGDRVVAGEHEAYRWDWRPLPGSPGEWLRHPVTGHAYDPDAPWWTVAHLDRAAGDIKDLWEPARFAWVYDLVRASLVTGDPRYAESFARRFADFAAGSSPFRGPHWSCGQETAIRAIALLYAEANLPATPGVEAMLAASAERIDDAFGYAVSQRNNHALSEAVGLLALGARFSGQHPRAEQWLRRGCAWVERLVLEQFAADGWYIQHSFTYLRLALDQCVIAQRVLAAGGETLSAPVVGRLARATELLSHVMQTGSGTVPNHGANDGAFVHPITSAAYRDFRPVVTAACASWGFPLPLNITPCAETLAWLGRAEPARGPVEADGVWRGASGWAAARVGEAQVFLRAGRYTSRPSHLDPLHADVRFGAREVVVDAGTYAYNGPPPWRNALVSARVHNGPLLDGREPGIRGPRFLWYQWPRATIALAERTPEGVTIVAEGPRGVRRTVRVAAQQVVIEDEVPPGAATEVAVRWLLHPAAPLACVAVDGPAELHHAEEGDPLGWYSPLYGKRVPSRALVATRAAADGVRISTTISPPPGPASTPGLNATP